MSESANRKLESRLLGPLAFAYTVFVVYGSLVPLKFHAMPWDAAVAKFAAIPFLELGIGSRADWVANLLLFIPLAYLWMGVLTRRGGTLRTALATLVVFPAAAALSVGIEFTQLFFPQRTVSQNDIFAETLGALIGVLIWWATGSRFLAWLRAWQTAHTQATLAERLARVYLVGLMVYNVMPLDLTISVVEIFHKWRAGKVNLIPFADMPGDPAQALYEIATDALIWVPLALLWRLNGTRSAQRVWTMTVAAAALIEFMQLFVYSRVTDVTDVLTAAVGAAAGCVLGGRLAGQSYRRMPTKLSNVGIPFMLALAWMVGLCFVFWYPFNFHTDGAFLRSRLDALHRVPFEVYYFGTEFRAITEVLRKTLLFAPLGGLLAWGVARMPWRWRAPLFALSMLILTGLPAVIELVQFMLPEKIADATDWLLAWAGGLAGYGSARYMLRAGKSQQQPLRLEVERITTLDSGAVLHLALTLGGLTVLLWGTEHAPFMPYNVRELWRQNLPVLSAPLLALACGWVVGWPVWLAQRRISGTARLLQLPLGLLLYGIVLFGLLHAAVPDESLYDLAGSPILHWPGQWETGVRWLALALIPGTLIYLAVLSVQRLRSQYLPILHFLVAIPLLLLAYWGVIVEAATDNLVELIATPQPLACLALSLWLYTLFMASTLFAVPLTHRMRYVRLLVALLSIPLAMLLLRLGLVWNLDKYGQHFSALQFLLSTDRQHYAASDIIWIRYAALHVLVIAALACLQWPFFRYGRTLPVKKAQHEL
jgi:glycopeptide antibiotics resistance protein